MNEMEHEAALYDILQECSTLTPKEIVQKLSRKEGLVKNIIANLADQYKKQVGHPIYSVLFELYRSDSNEARCFVLQFLPVLVWIYLSAKSRRDKQGFGKLEAILLAIYNAEVHDKSDQKPKTFRLPSLSRPSIYHESSVDVMSQSALTESALSRHELVETPILGPTKQINKVTASNRMSILCVALRQYNNCISFMDKSSHDSYWLMAIRVAVAGFSELCTPEIKASKLADVISNEELARLTSHPRIPLSAEFIQELLHSLYFLMYNGCLKQAARATDSLHFRASHSLLASANILSNAIHHSLIPSNGLPHDGPLGLQVHLSGTHPVPSTPDSQNCLSALTTKGMATTSPMQYYSLGQQQTDAIIDNTKQLTHKKSHSTGYWKQTTKSHIELKDMSKVETDGGSVGKKCFSEDNIAVPKQIERTSSDHYTTKL